MSKIDFLKDSISIEDYIESTSSIDMRVYSESNSSKGTIRLYKNCPFCEHHDHFSVNLKTQTFISFSNCCCINGKNYGDLIDFVMLQHNTVTKVEAIKILEKYLGIPADEKYKSKKLTKENKSMKERALNNNITATKQYDFTQDCVDNIAIGQIESSYFVERGLTEDVIQTYRLAYTDGINNFLSRYKELQSSMYSQDVYKYVIPTINIMKDELGKDVFYIDSIIFRANDTMLNDVNMKNKNNNSNFELKKYYKPKGIPDSLFNERYITHKDALISQFELLAYKDTNNLFICEGQIDALTIEMIGYHALSLNSTQNANKFLDLIKNNLGNVKDYTFNLVFDTDTAGKITTNQVYKALTELNLNVNIISLGDSNEKQDINSSYNANPSEFIKYIDEQVELDYYKDTDFLKIDNFMNSVLNAKKETCFKTGFKKLDTALGGGLYTGLYVLGGVPGGGKTAFVNTIADNLARIKEDVLFYSLELSEKELMGRSISSMSALESLSVKGNTDDAISVIDIKNAYTVATDKNKAVTFKRICLSYRDTISKNKITKDCGITKTTISAIKEDITKVVKRRNRTPIIFIDYLQVIGNDEVVDDINAASKNIKLLKQLSIDLNAVIIVNSSYNRTNYLAKANIGAFKNSGDIEYTADCIMAIQFRGVNDEESDKLTQAKFDELISKDIREIELCFLKNRNWKVGIKVGFDYMPAYNAFAEV